ncbi:class I SAM-dependent methyltransferase [Amphibacillus sp. Q70]|uniref:class I SAM-dependent methyltransferase n=1 Tax=Amphibacillus sp. Q70 TaxID=3453416 RepID=UPI003F84B561
MFSSLSKHLEQPPLYARTEVPFWDDEHISKQMLKAHLDPNFEGASRKSSFIEQSASWINETVPPSSYPSLLDLGCGPGIYAEKFTKMGYQVTGLDFSKGSIDYGRASAEKQKLNITYLYQNYLEMDLQKTFDFVTMIYCDYGALTTMERKQLMEKVYLHLKPGGKFLLDVFSMVKYKHFNEEQVWEQYADGGFWHEEAHLTLQNFSKYINHVTLEQTTVITDSEITSYHIWTTYFTKARLIKEVTEAGFKVCQVFEDVKGSPYTETSPTLAILLEKGHE